jgi:hypothetical protein
MRNKYAGLCQLCGTKVEVKKSKWRLGGITSKTTQNFKGLRCIPCSTTTKKGLKLTDKRLNN